VEFKAFLRGLFLIIGFILIFGFSIANITGNVVSNNFNLKTGSIIGILFIFLGVVLFLIENEKDLEEIVLKSKVKEDTTLYRLAKEIEGNTIIQRDINRLLEELKKGNENPGIGTRKLFKNISYLRGHRGGRVFYRPSEEGYEILGYAIGTGQGSGKNKNEIQVIERLKKLYS